MLDRSIKKDAKPKQIAIILDGNRRCLLWQSAHSELLFMDEYWPDFRKIDLMRAVRTYQRRSRRFGGDDRMSGAKLSLKSSLGSGKRIPSHD